MSDTAVRIQQIFECIERLESLKKQATVERSHFYVGSTTTEAIRLLYEFAGYLMVKSGSER